MTDIVERLKACEEDLCTEAAVEIAWLRAEVEALRKALSFYADESNHTYRQCNDGNGRIDLIESNAMFDMGGVARKALERT
jgi:hypothetical protein